MAIKSLTVNGHPVFALGLREAVAHGIKIHRPFPKLPPIHTITMYVGKRNQSFYYDYIMKMNPKRVIFNPGSENPEMEEMLEEKGVEVVHACTLVMLLQGSY